MSYSDDSEKQIAKAQYLATLALGLINQVERDEGLEPALRWSKNNLKNTSNHLAHYSGDHLNPDNLDDHVDWVEYKSTPVSEYNIGSN